MGRSKNWRDRDGFMDGYSVRVLNGRYRDQKGRVATSDSQSREVIVVLDDPRVATYASVSADDVEVIGGEHKAGRWRAGMAMQEGDRVRLVSGPYIGLSGSVESVDEEHAILGLTVDIFGKDVPIYAGFPEVERG